jgi:CrcB protein
MNIHLALVVGIGGFNGAVLRVYSISFINSITDYPMPVSTIIVNMIGSFILGGFFAYSQHYSSDIFLKSFLATGLLGAFTTFSTFAIESVFLLSSINLFLLYVLSSTIGSILMAFIAYRGFLLFI